VYQFTTLCGVKTEGTPQLYALNIHMQEDGQNNVS